MHNENINEFNNYGSFKMGYEYLPENEREGWIETYYEKYPLYVSMLLESCGQSKKLVSLYDNFDFKRKVRGALFGKKTEDDYRIECMQVVLLIIMTADYDMQQSLCKSFLGNILPDDDKRISMYKGTYLAKAIKKFLKEERYEFKWEASYFEIAKMISDSCARKDQFFVNLEYFLEDLKFEDNNVSEWISYYSYLIEHGSAKAAVFFLNRIDPDDLFNEIGRNEMRHYLLTSGNVKLFFYYYENINRIDASYTYDKFIKDLRLESPDSIYTDWMEILLFLKKMEDAVKAGDFDIYEELLINIDSLPEMLEPLEWANARLFVYTIQEIMICLIKSNKSLYDFIKRMDRYNVFLYDKEYIERIYGKDGSLFLDKPYEYESVEKYKYCLDFLRQENDVHKELSVYLNSFIRYYVNLGSVISDIYSKEPDVLSVLNKYRYYGTVIAINPRKRVSDKFKLTTTKYFYFRFMTFGVWDAKDPDLIKQQNVISFIFSRFGINNGRVMLSIGNAMLEETDEENKNRDDFGLNVLDKFKSMYEKRKYMFLFNGHVYKVSKLSDLNLRHDIAIELLKVFYVLAEDKPGDFDKLLSVLKNPPGINLNEFRFYSEQEFLKAKYLSEYAEKVKNIFKEVLTSEKISSYNKKEIYYNSIARKYVDYKVLYDALGDELFDDDMFLEEHMVVLTPSIKEETKGNKFTLYTHPYGAIFYSETKFYYETDTQITLIPNARYKAKIKEYSPDRDKFIVEKLYLKNEHTPTACFKAFILALYDLKNDKERKNWEKYRSDIEKIPDFVMNTAQIGKFSYELSVALKEWNKANDDDYALSECCDLLHELTPHNPFRCDRERLDKSLFPEYSISLLHNCMKWLIKRLKDGSPLIYYIYIYNNSFLSCIVDESDMIDILINEGIIYSPEEYNTAKNKSEMIY